MSKKWLIALGVILVVGLLGLLAASVAFAQAPTPQPPMAAPQAPWGFRGRGGGGMVGTPGGVDELAKLLNMTSDEIWAQRVLGKTIADLAKEKGVDTQKLVDALVASQKTMLDQMATNGRLTQAQADKWLDWYKQLAQLQLTEPYGPGFGFGALGAQGGFGKMRGFGALRVPGRGMWDKGGKVAPTPPTPTP
jgi:hypothetical protein